MKFETQGTETIHHTEVEFHETPRQAARSYFDKHRKWPDFVQEATEHEDDEPVIHTIATAC